MNLSLAAADNFATNQAIEPVAFTASVICETMIARTKPGTHRATRVMLLGVPGITSSIFGNIGTPTTLLRYQRRRFDAAKIGRHRQPHPGSTKELHVDEHSRAGDPERRWRIVDSLERL